ncbi:hypothetical protein LUZ60_012709 [Juncus effusus]|nr:hypothetical protein LUZ60_012709 [Juncus effusus]
MKRGSNYSTSPQTSSNQEIRAPNSSRYKGVVPQHNGRWGAQIYERHRRIWLGTFCDEIEAAKAYDIAAQKYRGSEAITNFKRKWESSNTGDLAELAFLAANSKEEIVDMLRKHTYHEEFKHSLRKSRVLIGSSEGEMINCDKSECTFLFRKAVTPSDVGKLNRLVIPKIHAEKHFQTCLDPKGVLINFEDGEGKMWRFRYSYWKSSQSYVLTKGWSRFVKEKGLKAGDVVSFWKISGLAGLTEFLIDCKILKKENYVHSFVGKLVELHDNYDDCGDKLTVRLFGVNIYNGQGKGNLDMEKGMTHERIQSSYTEAFLDLELFGNGKIRREERQLQEEEPHLTKKQCLLKFV